MVKSKRITHEKEFLPISLIIESQEELDFLRGLFQAGYKIKKEDCDSYNEILDTKFWKEIEKW